MTCMIKPFAFFVSQVMQKKNDNYIYTSQLFLPPRSTWWNKRILFLFIHLIQKKNLLNILSCHSCCVWGSSYKFLFFRYSSGEICDQKWKKKINKKLFYLDYLYAVKLNTDTTLTGLHTLHWDETAINKGGWWWTGVFFPFIYLQPC